MHNKMLGAAVDYQHCTGSRMAGCCRHVSRRLADTAHRTCLHTRGHICLARKGYRTDLQGLACTCPAYRTGSPGESHSPLSISTLRVCVFVSLCPIAGFSMCVCVCLCVCLLILSPQLRCLIKFVLPAYMTEADLDTTHTHLVDMANTKSLPRNPRTCQLHIVSTPRNR